MKKIILPIAIIFVLILSIIFISSINNTEQPIDNSSETKNEINENIEQPEETVKSSSIYEEYNIEPGSYEAYLLDQYSGDESFSFEDLDKDGLPDGIFKEEAEEQPIL